MYRTITTAKNNIAEKALELSELGRHFLTLSVRDSYGVIVSYLRKNGKSMQASGDTKVRQEPAYSGDSLADTPVAPGSLILSCLSAPTLIDRDRDGKLWLDRTPGEVLSRGTNGATSAPASKTFTAAGKNFTTAGVFAGDLLVITRTLDRGSYTIRTVGTTTLVVDEQFPTGSLTNCDFIVHSADLQCGEVNYFSGLLALEYPASPASKVPAARGTALGTVNFPINLSTGDKLSVDVDGAGAVDATFTADPAEIDGSGSFAASASESLVVITEDGGGEQTIVFGAGTETTAAGYAAKIDSQITGAHVTSDTNTLEGCIAIANEMRTDYTAHIASTGGAGHHLAADAVNVVTEPVATNLATAILLANELSTIYTAHRAQAGVHHNNDGGNAIAAAAATDLPSLLTLVADLKTKYNGHLAAVSEVEECITLLNEMRTDYSAHLASTTHHDVADAVNVPAVAAATDEASAILLANDLKAKYTTHRDEVGVHHNDDAGNAIVAANATNAGTLVTLTLDLKAKYNAHLIATSELDEAITLVNELLLGYEAHRASTSFHLIADAVNVIAAPPASDLASAYVAANDLKAKYNAHRAQAGVHVNNDAGNAVSSPDADTMVKLIALANEIKLDFNAHLAASSDVDEAITLLNEARADYETHRASAVYHDAADATNVIAAAVATDLATAYLLANDIKAKYNAHIALTGGSAHPTADATNGITSPDADTVAKLVTLANEIKTDFNAHLTMTTTEEEAVALANELRTDYEAHRILTVGPVHGSQDGTNVIAEAAATDLATAILLANDLKAKYEAHRVDVTAAIHGGADATNVVTAATATDLASVALLLNDIQTQYNAHLAMQPVVHGIADAVNTSTASAVGTADVHLIEDTTDVVAAPAVGTAAVHLTDDVTNPAVSDDVGTSGIHIVPDVTNTLTSASPGAAAVHTKDDVTNVVTSSVDLITIISDTKGTDAYLKIVSGTGTILTKLGLIALTTAVGSGSIADINAVTFAEYKAIVEAAVTDSLATLDETGKARLSSATVNTGVASTIQITGTARTKFGFDAALHTGADPGAQVPVLADYTQTTLYAAGKTAQTFVTNQDVAGLELHVTANGGSSRVEIEGQVK